MSHDPWRMGFHLMPPVGWLNDPNGLCQLGGTYHVFHQYSPDWPAPDAPRGWGHFMSEDLVHWRSGGRVFAIAPDTPDETSGAYSGCAVPTGAGVRFYYTGNVKETGDFDYVRTGRRSVQILVESPDGTQMGEKHVLLRNDDYPSFCTCHVRDPKVWRSDGAWWMILGARDVDDAGLVLVLRSDDGVGWENYGTVRTDEPFGFMWECPDRIALDGREWLSICPQGMQSRPWANGIRDVSGYLPLPAGESLGGTGSLVLDERDFRPWDHGFDFYAPQSFVDESGRTILISWMGMPEAPYESAPDGLSWCHCLTVPRVVTATAEGGLLQHPVPELERLRKGRHELDCGGTLTLSERRADILLAHAGGPFELWLDGALAITWDGATLSLRFSDNIVGCGRTTRTVACDCLRNLRVLVDNSAVEVFANDGEATFATRWFPRSPTLTIDEKGHSLFFIWEMGDGMAGTYE